MLACHRGLLKLLLKLLGHIYVCLHVLIYVYSCMCKLCMTMHIGVLSVRLLSVFMSVEVFEKVDFLLSPGIFEL